MCKALRTKIEGRDDVKSVRFLNQTDATTTRSPRTRSSRTSPARTPSRRSFIVKLDNPEQHKDFDAAMQGQPGVLNVLNQKE